MRPPWLLLIIITLIGGITPLAAKVALHDIPAFTLGWIRFGSAGMLHVVTLYLFGQRLGISGPGERGGLRFDRTDWPRLFWLGLLCVPINQFGFLVGTHKASASHAGLFYAMAPVIVFWFSVAFGMIRFDARMLMAALLAATGALILIRPWARGLTNDFLLGDLLLLSAVTSYSLFIVLSRPLLERYGALKTLTAVFLVGAVCDTPLALIDIGQFDPAAVSLHSWLGFGCITIFTSYLNYLLIYVVMGRYEATRAMIVINGSFLVTAFLGWLLLDEHLGLPFLLGALLISSAILLDSLRKTEN